MDASAGRRVVGRPVENRDGDDRHGDRHRTDQERPATRGTPGLIGKGLLERMGT